MCSSLQHNYSSPRLEPMKLFVPICQSSKHKKETMFGRTMCHSPLTVVLLLLTDLILVSVSSVQLLSYVWLFASPQTIACQASLSITDSRSLLKHISIESMMPSNHLILCRPLLLLSWYVIISSQVSYSSWNS